MAQMETGDESWIVPPKRALLWVLFWVGMALAFGAALFHYRGAQTGSEFITCYIIEWSLSVDNLFVFLMIFHSFGIDRRHQRRALQWGIIGAVVLRLMFILLGLGLVWLFEPVIYVFGSILIWSGIQMAVKPAEEKDVRNNRFVKLVRRRLPVTEELHGSQFFVKTKTGLMATPLFLVLVVIDVFDVVFAVDSIPAAFAITRDSFVIFSANTFAIMGLRSLYFLLEHANRIFRFLRIGVAIVLVFVGLKMVGEHFLHISTVISLAVVVVTLAISVLASLVLSSRNQQD